MPFTYDHIEDVILDGTQRGLFNSFVASTWSGNPNNVTEATMNIQATDVVVVQATGTKDYVNANALPDPPLDIVSTDGAAYTVQSTDRGSLNAGQIVQMNNFIASVWPGSVSDVVQMQFTRTGSDMRAKLFGELTAATGAELPQGKRFRMKTKT